MNDPRPTLRVVVYHGSYGCDTGCCGHYVIIDPSSRDIAEFDDYGYWSEGTWADFTHCDEDDEEARKAWAVEVARRVVDREYSPEHTFDLDWDRCLIDGGCA